MSFYRTRFDRSFTDSKFGGPIASFAGPLDAFTADLAGSWSVARRLLTSYTGALLRVRRSSDNTEQDIGFASDGSLDTAALLSFCGANSGFVRTVYDQSGNARNFGQSTAANQPRIVNAGVVEVLEGKPTMLLDGSNDGLLSVTSFPALPQWWGYVLSRRLATGSSPELWALVSFPDSLPAYRLWESTGTNIYYNNNTGPSATIPYANNVTYGHLLKGAANQRYAKSSAGNTISDTSDNTVVGGVISTVGFRNDASAYLNGRITEWALCSGALSSTAEAALWADLNANFATPIP
jgi:hypothetical protein